VTGNPAHDGLLLVGVADGVGLIVTLVTAVAIQPEPGVLTVIRYTPAFAVVTLLIKGFAIVEVKPVGPTHDNVIVPVAVALANKLTVPPVHTGLLFVGAAVGTGLTVTVVVPELEQPVEEVTNKV
jgi:hypothetical protein